MRWMVLCILLSVLVPTECFSRTSAVPESIIVTHAKSMPPLSFLDEEGRPAGLIIDLWREWEGATGIPVCFRLTEWQNTFTLIESGGADVIGGLFYSPERAMKLAFAGAFVEYSGSYFASRHLAVRKVRSEIDEPLAVVMGDYAVDYLRDNERDVRVDYYPSAEALFYALERGSVSFFLMDTALAEWKLEQMGERSRFLWMDRAYERDLQPAVQRGRDQLVMLINEGFQNIPAERKEEIISSWIPQEGESSLRLWDILGLGAAALLVGFAMFIFTRMSRRPKLI